MIFPVRLHHTCFVCWKSGVTHFMRKNFKIILYLHFAQQRQPSAEVQLNIQYSFAVRWWWPNIQLQSNSKIWPYGPSQVWMALSVRIQLLFCAILADKSFIYQCLWIWPTTTYCAEHAVALYWNWKTNSEGNLSFHRCNWSLCGKQCTSFTIIQCTWCFFCASIWGDNQLQRFVSL